jgi:ABC-type cobalamin/Fe3+-siderophores transport system ATPase subunit
VKIKIHDKKKLQRIIKEEREAALQKKSIFVLVGPPSVGKSTWIKSTFKKQNPYVISRDDVVNQVVSGMGWTYDDMFVSPPDPGMCRPVNKKEKLKNADQIKDESGCASAQPESVKRKWVLTKLGDVDKKFGTVEEPPAYVTWQRFSYSKVAAANNKVHQLFTKRVAGAQPSGRDVVVDMTNMNARARKGAMQAIEGFEGDYKKVAIVFGFCR